MTKAKSQQPTGQRRSKKDVENFKCSICLSTWAKRSDYSRHLRTHGDQPKRFKCPSTDCDKAFNQKTQLRTHLNVHSGNKPHKCRYCGQAYGDQSSRNRHEHEKHEPQFGLQCSECPYTCKRRKQLSLHRFSAHSLGTTDEDVLTAKQTHEADYIARAEVDESLERPGVRPKEPKHETPLNDQSAPTNHILNVSSPPEHGESSFAQSGSDFSDSEETSLFNEVYPGPGNAPFTSATSNGPSYPHALPSPPASVASVEFEEESQTDEDDASDELLRAVENPFGTAVVAKPPTILYAIPPFLGPHRLVHSNDSVQNPNNSPHDPSTSNFHQVVSYNAPYPALDPALLRPDNNPPAYGQRVNTPAHQVPAGASSSYGQQHYPYNRPQLPQPSAQHPKHPQIALNWSHPNAAYSRFN
ncbi:hypothetical protein FRC12_014133 [Ceratobasidium sp. 428]|nr:hypothetical protein FRC12_014133 [Ceratobasidium sp. 428]